MPTQDDDDYVPDAVGLALGASPPSKRSRLSSDDVVNEIPQTVPFKICDMQRLKRFLILGCEENTYHSTAKKTLVQNILCVIRLLANNRFQEVLDTIEKFSVDGTVAKDHSILAVLSLCANHSDLAVRKAAYAKVTTICNIPTKLFRFIDFTQNRINEDRSKNPPETQLKRKKRKLVEKIDGQLEEMQLDNTKPKEPSEDTVDTSLEVEVKKVNKKENGVSEYKKVNTTPRKSSGWGRMRRKAVSNFYVDEKKDACRLLYLITKYKQRYNWSHQDVLRYAHPELTENNILAKNLVLKYAMHGYDKMKNELENIVATAGVDENVSEVIDYMKVINDMNKLSPDKRDDQEKLLGILKIYGIRSDPKEFTNLEFGHEETEMNIDKKKSSIHIVREHLPTGFLKSKEVWEAMLADMPVTAMIRNLGIMSQRGLFDTAENVKRVVDALGNVKQLKAAKVHPMKILIAMQQYNKGRGDKGSLRWTVNKEIVKALNGAFYLSFNTPKIGQIFKTNKKYMLCLDVSESCDCAECTGSTDFARCPAMASVAMAMITWHIEDHVEIVAFGGKIVDMKGKLNKNMRIPDVMKVVRSIKIGGNDCSSPMVHAKQKNLDVDVFIVYTASNTCAGRVHPMTALKDYNKNRVPRNQAKLIVCGMQSNRFTIADENEPNTLNIVGFDPSVPEIISEFAKDTFGSSCDELCDDCYKKMNIN